MPVSTLAANFATVAVRLSGANSAHEDRRQHPERHRDHRGDHDHQKVPTRALPSPPPGIPAAEGAPKTPRAATGEAANDHMKSTETKGTSARADIVRASTVMPPLKSVCQDLKDRRRFRRVTGRCRAQGSEG